MRVHPITTPLRLPPDDPSMELLLIQWHTPTPTHGHSMPDQVANEKVEVLRALSGWLRDRDVPNPDRPLFIATPELSTPLHQRELLNDLVSAPRQPTVLILGLDSMTWGEYRALMGDLPDMPDPEGWLAGGTDAHRVNAALIVIKDAEGTTTYVQPKVNPADPENIFRSNDVLLFCSDETAPGVRLNFSVHICADFTQPQVVREFRQACVGVRPQAVLDLAFGLQMNPDQHREEFKQGLQAFFAPPGGLIPTRESCVVFLNNAGPQPGKNPEWGRSRLLFSYARRWRPILAHTYWMRDEGPHDHQSVILREYGPGVYDLHYTPRELVDDGPGRGHPRPFLKNYARFAPLPFEDQGGGLEPRFEPIPPVGHWLSSEWRDFLSRLLEGSLDDNHVHEEVKASVVRSAGASVREWSQHLSLDDEAARALAETYFVCFENEEGFPSKTQEPKRWCRNAESASHQFLSAYCLLSLASRHVLGNLQPASRGSTHARCSQLGRVAFVWANSRHSCQNAIQRFLSRVRDKNPGELAEPRRLLVIVDPADNIPQEELDTMLQGILVRITTVVDDETPEGMSPPGEVVDPEQEYEVRALALGRLMAPVFPAQSEQELLSSLAELVG